METSLAAPAPMPGGDPVKVSGRRFGAFLIDFVLLLSIVPTLIFFAVSRPTIYTDSPGCTFLEVRELVPSGQTCLEVTSNGGLEGTWVLPNTGYVAAALYVLFFLIAIEWILQGLTGMTIGKLLFGIRTVNAAGTGPGIFKQFLRGLLWIVDAFPYCASLPLVAIISILATKRNQRVGDLVAGTYVVRSSARGTPVPGAPVKAAAAAAPGVAPPVATAPPVAAGYAPPPPADGFPAAPPIAAEPVATPGWAAPPPPSDPTTVHAPADEPTIIQPAVPGLSDGDATTFDGTPVAPEPPAEPVAPPAEPVAEPAPAATATAAEGGPQWDPARNAYIQWDPNQGTWLVYDDAAAQWKPIS